MEHDQGILHLRDAEIVFFADFREIILQLQQVKILPDVRDGAQVDKISLGLLHEQLLVELPLVPLVPGQADVVPGADQAKPRVSADHIPNLAQVIVDGVPADEHPLLQVDEVDLPAAEQKFLDQINAALLRRLGDHLLAADVLGLHQIVVDVVAAAAVGPDQLAAVLRVDGLHVGAYGSVRHSQRLSQIPAGDGLQLIVQ